MKKRNKTTKAQRRRIRLCAARRWIAGYTGPCLIGAYAKHCGLSPADAFHELKILGIIRPNVLYLDPDEGFPVSDDTYFLISGYSGGAPYGITWEERGLRPYERFAG